jgi:hypothetical protein
VNERSTRLHTTLLGLDTVEQPIGELVTGLDDLNTSESVFPVSMRLDLAVVGKSDFLLGPEYDEASVSIEKFRSFD